MGEHTKEPWKHTPGTYVTDDHGIAVCRVDFGCRTGAEATANMRRIVECVNAMAGIDNPQEWVDNARFYSHETVSAIVRERDELAEVVEAIEMAMRLPGVTAAEVLDWNSPIRAAIRAAFAKYRQPAEGTKIQYGCHCDLENMPEGYKPDECVFDAGNLSDCVYAKEGMSKWQCVHWKPISTSPELFPGTLDALRDLGRDRG